MFIKNKELVIMAGLPRSCSTLALNILNQNPNFNCESTSGILTLIVSAKLNWQGQEEFQAFKDKDELERRMTNVMTGMLNGFYQGVSKKAKIQIDKGRGWLGYLETAEAILGRKPKVIVPVRDILDILASFEKLHREACKTGKSLIEFTGMARNPNYFMTQTVVGRSQLLLNDDGILGIALNRVKDALDRGWEDSLFFLDAKDLTSKRQVVMDELHDFLGIESYEYNFDKVKQTIFEDDSIYGMKLHDIKPRVTPLFDTYRGKKGEVPIISKKDAKLIMEMHGEREVWKD